MLDEPYQPLWADRIKEGSDVGIKYPVDLACPDPIRERVQRIVLAAPGSEPIAEPQELHLVDRREDRHHRCLDNLVLDCCDAERPLPAICLRYVLPARWQRSIRPCVDAGVEINEVGLEVLRVLVPCHLIDTWRCALLQIVEGP